MTAALITIGDEILAGNTVDTNSNFIASQLINIGIPVKLILTVSDDVETIKNALESASTKADLVITTGGLGPTRDDRTKKAVCEFFGDDMRLDPETLEHLRNLLIKRKRGHLLEINTPQAEVPSRATVFQNFNGTAPGFMMRQEGKSVICLPGVPYEVKPLIKNQIIPYLCTSFQQNFILNRVISVVKFPESLLAKTIENFELNLPQNSSLSYLPIANRIKLKLTATGNDRQQLENMLQNQVDLLRPLIGDHVISEDGDKIEEILKEILVNKNLTVSTAESCTGGEISKLITSVPGVSEHFLGGVICYQTEKKTEILGVAPETIAQHTVVSGEVASEMSAGCRKLFATDIAISATGVAGPGSDEFDTKIGLVFYSIRVHDFEKTEKLFLPHLERKDFMNYVAMKALQDLVEILVN